MADTPIAAAYVTASSFTVASDKAVEFVAGVRVRADCGVDGLQAGVSTGYAGTTVGLTMDDGAALTANLVGVWHSNDTPDSLVNHGHTSQADGGDLPGVILADNSRPFTSGYIHAEGNYTGFFLTQLGAALDAKKSIYHVANERVALLLTNDAETVFHEAWSVGRNGATPTDVTVTPLLIAAGGLETGTINGQNVSGGVSTLDARGGVTFSQAVLAVAATPAHYARDILGGVAGYSVAADRRTLLTPNRTTCNIADGGFYLAGQQRLDLNQTTSWDSPTPDYTNPINRAGKNFYRYLVDANGTVRFVLSANATYPTGYTAATSRKIGSFHCVSLSYGAISGHTLTGFVTGDIIPGTVSDLLHQPKCVGPEGMTWDAGVRLWADLYGNSYSGGKLVSVFGGTLVDGTSSPAFHWLKAAQYLSAIGKRPFWQHEFISLALGCNEGTNISTSADPGVAGAFVDTAGRRMVSNNGCEGMAGIMWWWALDTASAGTAAWKAGFDANDSGVGGQMYMEPNRALVGGAWNSAALCGSRALYASCGPLALYAFCGVRGVAEPLVV